MWRISSCVILLVSLLSEVSAQTFGNEWIDSEKTYYKIQVAEDGLYRVTSSELTSAGVPVSNIAAGRYQLFHNGEEVAIFVRDDNGDGRLDSFDFFGEKNDGRLDTEMYVAPEAQPHDYYSLFSDTSAYFLTWHLSNIAGKRMAFSSLKDASGLTPVDNHSESLLQLQTSSYSSGVRYGSSYDIQSAVYDYGEGWTGPNISKNGNRRYDFTLANFDSGGPKPTLEVVLNGISNFSHVTEISAGPNASSLRSIGQASFNGRFNYTFTGQLEWSDVGADGTLVVQVTSVGVAGQTDVVSVAYVSVGFAQNLNLTSSSKTYQIPDSSNPRQYAVVSTNNASVLSVYDVTNPNKLARVASTAYSNRLEFVYQDTTALARSFLVLSSGDVKAVPKIERASIGSVSTSSDYLIISHKAMNQQASGVNPVDAYATYRRSAAGGGHDVGLVYMDQLYDQFSYGITSPLAVKRYLAYMMNQGDPKFVFLIGKGTSVNLDYHRQMSTSLLHFVPTFGYPGSDALFSVNGSVDTKPQIPIGRVNAFSSADVKVYLDKVKEMESQAYDQLWRKNLLHLSGGQTPSELSSFANYINNFRSQAVGDYLGGQVSSLNKNSTDDVKIINVADEVNSGLSMITFFGHSSGVVTDIEIGRASAPSAGYSNKGKYPTILVNGCNAGGIFGNTSAENPPSTLTFGEDWIRTPDAGAIGFIANSDFALSSNLKRYTDLFYLFAFADSATIGRTTGEIMNLVAERYFSIYGEGSLSQAQVYQTVLQGDPAMSVFGAQSPDYELNPNAISASGYNQDRVVANVDSFQLKLPIRNYGRTVTDSLEIQVIRTFSDGSQRTYVQQFERVLRLDTISFSIVNGAGDMVEGTNNFVISIDPENDVEELNENNNSGTFDLFIPKGNTIALYPVAYGTVSETEVDLVWQSANMLEQNRQYSLQIDTTSTFTSLYSSSHQINGGLFNMYNFDLSSLPDSTTIYWRTRFAEAVASEDTNWVNSSFTLVLDQPQSWAQIGHAQFEANARNGVSYDISTGIYEFEETSTGIQLNTHGPNSTLQYEDYQVVVDGLNLLLTDNAADPTCKRRDAINAVVFDRQTAQPYRPLGVSGSDVFNDLVCGRLPQMVHNFNESNVLGANRYLDALVEAMDDRDVILLFSFGTVNFSNWDAQLIASLNLVGIQTETINGLQDGQPVIFVGKKGSAEGEAIEITSNGSSIPVENQALELISTVTGKFSSGNVTSTRIGPAFSWDTFLYNVNGEVNDSWRVDISGVTESGQVNQLFVGNRMATSATEVDLQSVDANQYPFLQLDYIFADLTDQTPPTLDSWSVAYQQVPEGILSPTSFDETASLQEGEIYTSQYAFANISTESFTDSLDVNVAYTNINSGDRNVESFKIAAPLPGDSSVFEVTQNTRGQVGDNNVSVAVQAPNLENYVSNNAILLSNAYSVTADEVNPVLDVTIDGSYILDGDIVSPEPTIRIVFKDENQYLFKDDTTGLSIELRRECEECSFERVNLSSPEVSYTPASEENDFEVNYAPEPLENGTYTLRVQGADESGNQSGVMPYEVSFEVINESSITHFYPYPNPFSTSTRFVFTLTGSVIPDQIKIQIMTVTGRVIREITQDEIGPLKIGNNITEYAWDGRDEFGDQLANGVYLYKVFIRQNGESMDHRVTTADRAFKNGIGKIYLLR